MTGPIQTSGGSGPPRRHKRVSRRWIRLPSFGWALGLIITTAVIYSSALAYQRWTDDEARLEALEYRASVRAAPTPPVPAVAEPASPTRPLPQAVSSNAWTSGTWERSAQQYIATHLAQDTSSANPPQHRPRHPRQKLQASNADE